jgi:hypothetical protein
MPPRRRYRKKADHPVVAVRLDLDTEGFAYRKWGAVQHCKRGDWIVTNEGETYTVDGEVFARTYRQVGPGLYRKVTPVWAEVASRDGSIATLEGVSHYRAGDYLVYNDESGQDGWCMDAERFESLYEPDDAA